MHGRARAFRAVDAQVAAAAAHRAIDHREAEARAARSTLGGEERVEGAGADLRAHPRPVVGHDDLGKAVPVGHGAAGDPDRAAPPRAGDRVAGVGDEVQDRGHDLRAVAAHGHVGLERRIVEGDGRVDDVLGQRAQLGQQVRHQHRLDLGRAALGKAEQAVDEFGPGARGAQRGVEVAGDARVARRAAFGQLDRTHDGRQQVVEVMGDAAGELAQRVEPVGPVAQHARAVLLGHVLQRHDGPDGGAEGRRFGIDADAQRLGPAIDVQQVFRAPDALAHQHGPDGGRGQRALFGGAELGVRRPGGGVFRAARQVQHPPRGLVHHLDLAVGVEGDDAGGDGVHHHLEHPLAPVEPGAQVLDLAQPLLAHQRGGGERAERRRRQQQQHDQHLAAEEGRVGRFGRQHAEADERRSTRQQQPAPPYPSARPALHHPLPPPRPAPGSAAFGTNPVNRVFSARGKPSPDRGLASPAPSRKQNAGPGFKRMPCRAVAAT